MPEQVSTTRKPDRKYKAFSFFSSRRHFGNRSQSCLSRVRGLLCIQLHISQNQFSIHPEPTHLPPADSTQTSPPLHIGRGPQSFTYKKKPYKRDRFAGHFVFTLPVMTCSPETDPKERNRNIHRFLFTLVQESLLLSLRSFIPVSTFLVYRGKSALSSHPK